MVDAVARSRLQTAGWTVVPRADDMLIVQVDATYLPRPGGGCAFTVLVQLDRPVKFLNAKTKENGVAASVVKSMFGTFNVGNTDLPLGSVRQMVDATLRAADEKHR